MTKTLVVLNKTRNEVDFYLIGDLKTLGVDIDSQLKLMYKTDKIEYLITDKSNIDKDPYVRGDLSKITGEPDKITFLIHSN